MNRPLPTKQPVFGVKPELAASFWQVAEHFPGTVFNHIQPHDEEKRGALKHEKALFELHLESEKKNTSFKLMEIAMFGDFQPFSKQKMMVHHPIATTL